MVDIRHIYWRDRTDMTFAEIAEALGVPTDHVAGVFKKNGAVIAFYARDIAVNRMYRVKLARGLDGICKRISEDTEVDLSDVADDPLRIVEHLGE